MDVATEHSPGPWEARSGGRISLSTPSAEQDYPAHVVRVFRDDKGRRVTQFIAQCNGATSPNDANAKLIAQVPELLKERDRLAGTLGLKEQQIMALRDENAGLMASLRTSRVYIILAICLAMAAILVGVVAPARKAVVAVPPITVGVPPAISQPPTIVRDNNPAGPPSWGPIPTWLSDSERSELERLRKQRAILDPFFKSGRLVIIGDKR